MRFEPISRDVEPLSIEDHPAPLVEMTQGSLTYSMSQMSGTMWSTETSLPLLPHIFLGSTSSSTSRLAGEGSPNFGIPKDWNFDPVLQGWVTDSL